MAAIDYKVCPGMADAYFAKVSKKNPNQMLSDRRKIEDKEILMLIDWYFKTHYPNGFKFKSAFGYTIVVNKEEKKVDDTINE